MKSSKMVKSFTRQHPFVGPIFWTTSTQYFLIMVIAALAWEFPYSVLDNPISDLGNTECGIYAERYVCSPLHDLMNASFILLGTTMALGATLIYQEFRKSRGSLIGFSFMAAAGLGTVLVGIFPENTVAAMHFIGALLAFLIGNLGLVILGLALPLSKPMRLFTLFSGVVSLAALALFFTENYLGIGEGGMERLASHPQTLWIIVFGVYLTRLHMHHKD